MGVVRENQAPAEVKHAFGTWMSEIELETRVSNGGDVCPGNEGCLNASTPWVSCCFVTCSLGVHDARFPDAITI